MLRSRASFTMSVRYPVAALAMIGSLGMAVVLFHESTLLEPVRLAELM